MIACATAPLHFVSKQDPAVEHKPNVVGAPPAPPAPPPGCTPKEKKKEPPIPVPKIGVVPTYSKDYRADHRPPPTRIRWRPGLGRSELHVPYDLDAADSAWLAAYNAGQVRLSADKMELVMWKLETLNREATDRALDKAGAGPTERSSQAAAATTDHFPPPEAVAALVAHTGLRDRVCEAVQRHWREKRDKRKRPLLRMLEAPTGAQDNNPYAVFRPREKQSRPQTRRRRENDVRSYERLREVHDNLTAALQLIETVCERERKKRELVRHLVDEQRLRLRLRHSPVADHDRLCAETTTALKERLRRTLEGEAAAAREGRGGADGRSRYGVRSGRVTRPGVGRGLHPANAVTDLPPAPERPQPPAPFDLRGLGSLDLGDNAPLASLEKALLLTFPRGAGLRSGARARFGRGGRIIFDRCKAMTGERFGPRPGDLWEAGGGVTPAGGAPPLPVDVSAVAAMELDG